MLKEVLEGEQKWSRVSGEKKTLDGLEDHG